MTIRKWFSILLFCAAQAAVAQVQITVHADQASGHVSRLLTGACIEDVNHEIYGGLYSQMIFGESFQEPALILPPNGFRAYGGTWETKQGVLTASAGAGPKLVSDLPAFADGEARVEILFPDNKPGKAGLLVRLSEPAMGPENFYGYEVSLDIRSQNVRLARHFHGFELIQDTPCEVKVGEWQQLAVKMNGPFLEIFVNGKSRISFSDDNGAPALRSGTIGLRQWMRDGHYRNLVAVANGNENAFSFDSQENPYGDISSMWRAVQKGSAVGAWTIDKEHAFIGSQSQRFAFVKGQGEIGVENQGLNRWGLCLQNGKSYEGLIWAQCEQEMELWVALESGDGATMLAEKRISLKTGGWRSYRFELTPKATVRKGRFSIRLKRPGSVTVGYAFLQPGSWGRFKNLPVRRDVAEAMVDQGITVLRYGGSMINHPDYRWKKMIGPRDRRPPYQGTWYPFSSNGWGILDFMDFCEAASFAYIPAFNMAESAQDMADFIEYAAGGSGSEWGRRRIADGHRKPYRIKYLQLGNEERVNEKYADHFAEMAKAIWEKNPDIILVVGDFAYHQNIVDPFNFRGAASRITTLAGHQRILQLARQYDREVWFDVHVGTEGPLPEDTLQGLFSFRDALQRIADGARCNVVVFEFNAGNHQQKRALANALAIQAIERDGHIPIAISANGLQPDNQNDNDWDQGLLFLNPEKVWLQPPGYVTQMLSTHYVPLQVPCTVVDAKKQLDVHAKMSADHKTLVLQVVNPGESAVKTQIQLDGFVAHDSAAKVTELCGALDSANTAARPDTIIPKQSWYHYSGHEGNMDRTFAPYSFTIIKFSGKKQALMTHAMKHRHSL